ncbi:unnamed protein product [Mytilus edulis]|uniref:C-type lectin domain-containing protein n=1 Tax=Mytilus edulis TaxID=6550 RepID=A0A8S3V6X1_MYTED|nr:unnamed protein product [Mytilus edulis]
MLSIIVQGPLEVDSTLILSCIIPNFTGAAAWSKENIAETTCFNDFCIPSRHQNYTFSRNTSDIFVTIDPLSISENGTTWTCYHGEDSTSYTVFVQPSITTNQPPTEPSIPTNQPPTGSCQEPYQNIGKGCYSIHDDNISGDEAFASCTDPGAYLANFETLEEAMFMKVFLQKNKTGISYFVGGRNVNRYLSSGDWRWIKHGNATKMTYFAFAPGQPSWSAEKGEDCMFFYANDRYNFYNVMCDNGHFLGGFICEI